MVSLSSNISEPTFEDDGPGDVPPPTLLSNLLAKSGASSPTITSPKDKDRSTLLSPEFPDSIELPSITFQEKTSNTSDDEQYSNVPPLSSEAPDKIVQTETHQSCSLFDAPPMEQSSPPRGGISLSNRLIPQLVLKPSPSQESQFETTRTRRLELPLQNIEFVKCRLLMRINREEWQEITFTLPSIGDVPGCERAISAHLAQQEELASKDEELYFQGGYCIVRGERTTKRSSYLDTSADSTANSVLQAAALFLCDVRGEKFDLEIHLEYATFGMQRSPQESYAEFLQQALDLKMVKNFDGHKYIPRADLRLFCQRSVIRSSVDNEPQFGSWTQTARDAFSEQIAVQMPRLHAVCIYAGFSLSFLQHLAESGHSDHDRPPEAHKCEVPSCRFRLRRFHETQSSFFPAVFEKDQHFHEWNDDILLPIQFNKKTDDVGHGAFSTVYRVQIDPAHHSLSHKVSYSYFGWI
jgi:hypothetical protein